MNTRSVSWADKLRILQHELMCCCIVLSDLLERRTGEELDWNRIMLALRRIQAVQELP